MDSAGAFLRGHGLVVADAAVTSIGDSLTFGAHVALNAISTWTCRYPYCVNGLTGLGTTSVKCTGA
jgi:hypothetical protein